MPRSWRLSKIDGNAARGTIALDDHESVRLEIAWAHVTRSHFNAEPFARRQLRRSVPKESRSHLNESIETVPHECFKPLLRFSEPSNPVDRYVGYAPATHRVIQIAHHRSDPDTDRAVRRITIGRLTDQPNQLPQRWAFFSIAFTAPAAFCYCDAVLNVGDMYVRLIRPTGSLRNQHLIIRNIYPAQLALSRYDTEQWLTNICQEDKRLYLPICRGRLVRHRSVIESIDTSLGPALTCSMQLRNLAGLLCWRLPWYRRTVMIHDAAHDRLVTVQVGAQPEQIDTLLRQVLDGLYWTESPDDKT